MIARSLGPRLHQVLGIDAPILQSGMRGVAGVDLAGAVCNAGALGVLAALHLEPDQVRSAITELRSLTDRPFGVNIWLHDDVRRPPDPDTVPDDVVRGAQAVFNEFRPRFDLPPNLGRPPAAPGLVDAALDVMIEEQIPVFSAAVGIPEAELIDRFHSVGTKVVAMVANSADAIVAADHGVDVIVAQGAEAGGHRSHGTKLPKTEAQGISTLTLVAQVLDAIGARVPVVAAGGIVDGRGLAAMLALGADGVLLGSRFVATRESTASPVWKRRMTSGNRTTALTDGYSGQWARVLRTEFTDEWEARGATALPGLLQAAAGADLFAAAKRVDDDQLQPLYAGAGIGAMHDIPGAADVVTQMVAAARVELERLTRLL